MSYIDVAFMRAAGVDEDDYPDPEVESAIAFSQEYIERICLQYFEPREELRSFDGNGAFILPLDTPLISLEYVEWRENNLWITQDPENFVAYTRIPQDQKYPRISVRSDYRGLSQRGFYDYFPAGELNVRIKGQWGFVEKSGSDFITPRLIQKVCGILTAIWMNSFTDGELLGVIKQWGVVEERTSKHSYKLAGAMAGGEITGIPAIDNILAMYRRKAVITHV